jgi:hypothetical protein
MPSPLALRNGNRSRVAGTRPSTSSRSLAGGARNTRQVVSPRLATTTATTTLRGTSNGSVSSIVDNNDSTPAADRSIPLGQRHIDSTPAGTGTSQLQNVGIDEENDEEDNLTTPTEDIQQVLEKTRLEVKVSNENNRKLLNFYVRSSVFSRKKFVFSDKELKFDTGMAQNILVGVNIEGDEKVKLEWWNKNKNDVRKAINGKRNNVITILKKEVHSKSVVLRVFLLYFQHHLLHCKNQARKSSHTTQIHLLFQITEMGSAMPSLQVIQNLREEEEPAVEENLLHPYIDVCMRLLPCIVGKVQWKKTSIIHGGDITKIATLSDEAMMLVALENYYEPWVSHPRTSMNHPPRYTREGHGKDASKHAGWNDAGRKRYNELYIQVKKDRQADVDSGGHFTKAFIAEFDNQCVNSSRKRQREPEDDDDISCAEDDF